MDGTNGIRTYLREEIMFVQQQADELINAVTYVKENLSSSVEKLAEEVIKAFKN